ncbi:hypothetical protein SAMN02745118_01970 [Selenihalanaerobacter shriftii]|uniref:Uncharacterized protein n=1 Tax=Selenihalanaerobacter shriftii TaxID=142842 RepID=A0A1T4NYN5_9FIRM|nr:hypothetical protein SAMN02745118_01970 [Selenihalanaerobacter shriftii]
MKIIGFSAGAAGRESNIDREDDHEIESKVKNVAKQLSNL